MKFSEWITQKYITWRGNAIGQDHSITEFAAMLGVSQSLMAQWMQPNGKVPTSPKYISALIKYYGDEAYCVLGLPVPEDSVDNLPEPLRSISLELRETLAEYKVSGDSPQAGTILDEIMKKHGYSLTSTRD